MMYSGLLTGAARYSHLRKCEININIIIIIPHPNPCFTLLVPLRMSFIGFPSSVASRLYRPSLSEFACRYEGFCAVNSGVFFVFRVRDRVRVWDSIKFFT